MHHANLEKLKSLRLFGMVRALQELTGLDDRGRLDFDDQLALLIEREAADRTNAALEMRLKRAHLRQCFENLDLKASRGQGADPRSVHLSLDIRASPRDPDRGVRSRDIMLTSPRY
jgi:hypothetical protein